MSDKVKEAYDAFISYRHSELDQFVAVELHKRLEAFHLPKNIKKTRKNGEKTKITRVFRDRDELPITDNLEDPIIEALSKSEFLIVICTPRLLQSKWCQREIETFIEMHGRERVLAVLAEGEPGESFPEALCREERKIIQPDGTQTIEYVDVEPLAADVRGNSHKEIKKKIKEEILRLAAVMFKLAYDDLKQRHREQRLRRIGAISIGCSAVFLIFGSVSTYQAIQIHQKSKEIERQNKEILKSESIILGERALDKLESGDRLESIRDAYQAMPTNQEEPEKEVVSQAQYALTKALCLYDNGSVLQPKFYLEEDAQIMHSAVSPNMEQVLTKDSEGVIRIWNPMEQKEVFSIETNLSGYEEKDYCFLDENKLVAATKTGIVCYDIKSGKKLWEKENITTDFMIADEQENLIAIKTTSKIYILNGNGEEVFSFEKENLNFTNAYMKLYKNGKGLIFSGTEKKKGDTFEKVYMLDLESKKIWKELNIAYELVCDFALVHENTLVVGMEDFEKSESGIYQNMTTYVVAYDLKNGKTKWQYHTSMVLDFIVERDTHILLKGFYDIVLLDTKNGTKIREVSFENQVLNMYGLGNDTYELLLNNGDLITVSADLQQVFNFSKRYKILGEDLKNFAAGKGFYITSTYGESKILVYDMELGQDFTKYLNIERNFIDYCVNKKENRLAIDTGQENVVIWDVNNGEKVTDISFTDGFSAMEYIEEDILCVYLNSQKVVLYNTKDGSLKKEILLDDLLEDYNYWEYAGFSDKTQSVYFTGWGKILILPLEDEQQYQYMNEVFQQESPVSINYQGTVYAEADKESGKLKLKNISDNKEILTKEIRCAFIQNMFFSEDDKLLFVVYNNNSVAVYESDNLELVCEYTDFAVSVSDYHKVGDSCFVLSGSNTGYLVDRNSMEILGEIEGFLYYEESTNMFVCGDNAGIIYKVPFYSWSDLLEMKNSNVYAKLALGQK